MFILAADPGTVNCAFCIMDSETHEIVFLRNVNLFEDDSGTIWETDVKLIPFFLERFVKKNEELFSKCSLFVCESQIQQKMMRVQFGLEALFSRYGRAVTIHPNSVKSWAKTRMGNYTENKRKAVAWCNHNLEGVNLARFKEYEQRGLKQDDLADTIVMCSFAIDIKDELMTIHLKEKGSTKPKQKSTKKRSKKRARC
jgi:hypothetical protein